MADVSFTKLASAPGSDVWEAVFNATDKTTPVLTLNPNKKTAVVIKTTGSATCQILGYLENPENSGPISFPLVAAAATAASIDYVFNPTYPLSGIDFAGTVTGGDAVTIQVIQSEYTKQ